jgi:abortive infection bacteriophage resistance protein
MPVWWRHQYPPRLDVAIHTLKLAGYSFSKECVVSEPSCAPQRKKYYAKIPLSFEEQVTLLEKRGLVIDIPRDQVVFLFSQINYYHLEAYWFQFYDKKEEEHLFLPGTTFSQTWNVYCFDRKLRELLFHALERMEISIKTKFAYILASTYHSSHPLKEKNFLGKESAFAKAYDELKNEVGKSKETFIDHYKNACAEEVPPIWVAVEIMSFGEIAYWYNNVLLVSVRKAIAKEYGVLSDKVFGSWIFHLSYILSLVLGGR